MYEFYVICKDGTKETYHDLKYLYSLRKIPETDLNFLELRKKRTIKHDIYKLIPFSFFLVVPFSEFVLPPYLLFFPNAIPQRYVKFFLERRKRRFLERKQEIALKELNLTGDLKNLTSDQLMHVADSLKLEYCSFTFIISQTFMVLIKTPFFIVNVILWLARVQTRLEFKHWIFNYRFKFNYFPFEPLKRRLLLSQIRRFLENIWKEDRKLLEFDESKLTTLKSEEELKQYLEERGVSIAEKKDWANEVKEWRERVRNKQFDEFLIMMLENVKKKSGKLAITK